MSVQAVLWPADLDDASWEFLDDVLERFEESWRAAPPPQIEDFVPPPDHGLRERVLVELIKVDEEYRWESAQKQLLETYLGEWPELRDKPAIVAELLSNECLIRASVEAIPAAEELGDRFPDVLQQIDLSTLAAEAEKENRSREDSIQTIAKSDESIRSANGRPTKSGGRLSLTEGQAFGRYEIRGPLGTGAMGAVYRAYDPRLHREVALKVPQFADPGVLKRFVKEARAAAKIRHAGICPIYDVNQVDGAYYITMALIEGRSLGERMESGEFEPVEAARLVHKLAVALEQVHAKGIVHRDIKPSNVMLDAAGEPLLMDFGLARHTDAAAVEDCPDFRGGLRSENGTVPFADAQGLSANLSGTGSLVGTPSYMSPEQATGQPADARSDIYALGILLYELLTGKRPFSGPIVSLLQQIAHVEPPKPRELLPDLPEELEAICLKAIAKTPNDRYQSAGELADALQHYLDALPQQAVSHPWRRGLVGAIAAVAFVFAVLMLYLKTGNGTAIVEVNQADASVTLNDQRIRLETSREMLSLPVGVHTLEVEAPGFGKHSETLTIRWRFSRVEIKVRFNRKGEAIPIRKWIETATGPVDTYLSRDGATLYAAWGTEGNNAPLRQFDIASGRLLQTIDFVEYDSGRQVDHKGVVLSGDGRYLFTTNYYQRFISRVDLKGNNARTDLDITANDRVRHTWAVRLGITPDKGMLVVPAGNDGRPVDENNDWVSIIDVRDGDLSLVAEVTLEDEPKGNVRFSPDSRFAYLITRRRKSEAPKLYEIRLTPPYEVTRALPFPDGDLRDMVISNQPARAFVSDARHNKIWTVDLETFRTTSQIDLGEYKPGFLGFSRHGNLLAALVPANRTLLCFNPEDGTILGKVTGLRHNPTDIEFSANQEQLLVAHAPGGIAVVSLRHLLYSIVFASDRAGESYQIYRMDGDGRGVVRLTENHATDRSPRWSSDGRRIAFVSDRQGRGKIFLMDRDGQHLSMLESTDPAIEGNFETGSLIDWSPDGREIAYIGKRRLAIRVVDVESGKIRTLVQGSVGRGYNLPSGICWRKSDGAILFSSQQAEWAYNQDVLQVNPNTGEVTQITDAWGEVARYFAPAPSPNGRLVFLRRPSTQAPPSELLLANPDGSELALLASADDELHASPRWFPNGKEIMYSAKAGQYHHIYTMKLEDKKATQLPFGEFNDIEPDVTNRLRPSTSGG